MELSENTAEVIKEVAANTSPPIPKKAIPVFEKAIDLTEEKIIKPEIRRLKRIIFLLLILITLLILAGFLIPVIWLVSIVVSLAICFKKEYKPSIVLSVLGGPFYTLFVIRKAVPHAVFHVNQ